MPTTYSTLSEPSLLTSFSIMLLLSNHTSAALAFLFLKHGKLAHKYLLLGTVVPRIHVDLVPVHLWVELKHPFRRNLLWPTLSPVSLYTITMFIFIFFTVLIMIWHILVYLCLLSISYTFSVNFLSVETLPSCLLTNLQTLECQTGRKHALVKMNEW